MKRKHFLYLAAFVAVSAVSALLLLCTPNQNPFTDPNNIRVAILTDTPNPGDTILHTSVDSAVKIKIDIYLYSIVNKVTVDFGDKTFADTTNHDSLTTEDTLSFSHVYHSAGTFTITVTALSGNYQQTGHITVVVKPAALKLSAVTYNGNGSFSGAAPTDSNHYPKGATVTVRGNTGNLALTGHAFSGWNRAANGSGKSYLATDTLIMDSVALTLYVKWTIDTFKVSFNSNGGSAVDSQMVPYNAVAKEPAIVPTKAGNVFAGWYLNAALTTPFDFTTPIMTDRTLYAKWTAGFNVVYNGNNSTGGKVPADSTVYTNGQTVTVQNNSGLLLRAGYTFAGWNLAADGGGTTYNATNTFTIGTASVTLYAKWTPNTYTITFDDQSATVAVSPATKSVTAPATTVVTLPTAPTKTGFTFGGWFTAVGGGGKAFTADSVVTASDTVYARWIPPNSFLVTFNDQAATTAVNPTSKLVTAPATTVDALPTAPAKTGFTFGGWFTTASGGGTAFTATTPVNANDTVYAEWTPNTYTITFDDQSATTPVNPTIKTVTAPATTVVSLPAVPAKTGYTFGGWFTAVSGGGTAFIATTPVNANDTVYAKWTINSFVVKFNSNGGSVIDSEMVTYNTAATAPTATPTKTGYKFVTWCMDPSATNVFDFSTLITAPRTLYAQWIPIYTVVYNGNNSTGGTVPVDGQTYTSGANASVLGVGSLVRANYTFAGWNLAANGGGAVTYHVGDLLQIGTVNDTLYAQWTANVYTITLDYQGATGNTGSTTISRSAPNLAIGILPSAQTKTGYFFDGWFTAANGGGDSVKPTTTINSNDTFYAYWLVKDVDGNVYHTVQIGNQVWLQENLKTTKYRDGINQISFTDSAHWQSLGTTPLYCWYNNDSATYKKSYGALYNWYAASNISIPPVGWHVPSKAEWDALIANLGGDVNVLGGKLKDTGTTYWQSPNTGATDSSGFTGRPSGWRMVNASFSYIGTMGSWWSTDQANMFEYWHFDLSNNSAGYHLMPDAGQANVGLSIRCIRDY
ncbi:MAG: InlB B-repeat-containing protein [Chitinivibrionales bacterium]|nr:InlB B-repeat-containing protein [Chitinivibrionales bacterium]